MINIHCVQGLPGSGLTTLADKIYRQLIAQKSKEKVEIISINDFFKNNFKSREISGIFNRVEKLIIYQAYRLERTVEDVIIDSPNIPPPYCGPFKSIDFYFGKVIVYKVDSPQLYDIDKCMQITSIKNLRREWLEKMLEAIS